MSSTSMMTDCISHLNGSVYNGTLANNSKLYDDLIVPIPPLTRTETFLHIIFISQAIPINFFIGLVFILNKQLQQTPRNAFWIGIIAVNLLTVLIAALRLTLTYGGDQDGIVCFLFSLLTGKPYTILLLIQYLATLDRYYSESSPEFYKKYLTTRFVVFVQIYAFIFMLIATSLPHLTGMAALRCGFSLKIAESNMFLRSIYVVLCIFQFIKFHCKTRSNLTKKQKDLAIKKKSAQLSKNAENINSLTSVISLPSNTAFDDNNKIDEDQKEALVKVNIPADNNPENVDEEDSKVDKELVEANVKLLIDYVNLLIVTSPMLLFFFFGSSSNQMCEDSSEITTTVPYMGLSYFMYAVYGPLIFCFASKDFSKAARKMFTCKAEATPIKKNIIEKETGLIYSALV